MRLTVLSVAIIYDYSVDDSRQSFGRCVYYVSVTIKGEADWVEISWPYGDQPWSLRVEKEAAS